MLDRSRESTAFRPILRSFIMAASSPVVVVPVSLFSWSTNVVLGRPLPCCPWLGSQRIRRWAPSSGCRWQCPASRSRLAAILSLSLGSFPYTVKRVSFGRGYFSEFSKTFRKLPPSEIFPKNFQTIGFTEQQPCTRTLSCSDSMTCFR